MLLVTVMPAELPVVLVVGYLAFSTVLGVLRRAFAQRWESSALRRRVVAWLWDAADVALFVGTYIVAAAGVLLVYIAIGAFASLVR